MAEAVRATNLFNLVHYNARAGKLELIPRPEMELGLALERACEAIGSCLIPGEHPFPEHQEKAFWS